LSLTATGSVTAAPDVARLVVGVAARAPTALAASSDVARRTTAVLDALSAAGITEADRQTQHVGLVPLHARDERGAPLRIEGYEARQDLAVTVRDLGALGPLLDALLAAGAGSIGGIAFDVADREALLYEARRLAVAEARRLGALMADAAGATLGLPLSLTLSGDFGGPVPMMRAAMAESAPMPVAEGAITLTATVSATFALE
jgi:uncharacterized protein YggE